MTEDRQALVKEYFGSLDVDLATKEWHERQIRHTMLHYDRYHEASLLDEAIGFQKELTILDFGCGVGDYGMYFLRKGARVTFYDFHPLLLFVSLRTQKEKLLGAAFIPVPQEYDQLFSHTNIAIFGEVLEHLEHPLKAVQAAVNHCEWILTTAYPYMSHEGFKRRGHDGGSELEQEAVRALLEKQYTYTKFNGELRCWKRKETV